MPLSGRELWEALAESAYPLAFRPTGKSCFFCPGWVCLIHEWQGRRMQLGFIGTGEITSAIVTGLSSSGTTHPIWLSPRNAVIANGLAKRFPGISVASSNQEVLDRSDTVVIGVRPSVAQPVLAELGFRPDHQVISLVSGL